jgi:LacI family repressor for deo operon, udp, cdd, tsx, nupC, and nupG
LKQVSIRQVAKLAGVSIATVSRCLNDPERVSHQTRDRVQQAIQVTGYTPNSLAQSFRRGHTNLIMVVLPSIGDPFFTEVMQGIRGVVEPRGYSIIISDTALNTLTADEVGAMLVSRQADGIILLASVFPYGPEVLSRARRHAQPIVIGCETLSPALADLTSVHIDNVAAAADATRHLLSVGHRRVAFMTAEKSSLLTRDREAGYRQAMGEGGLDVDPAWVVEGGMSIEGALRATETLLGLQPRPTAVFCANDEMALACLHGLQEAGVGVPDEMSVMGFDDTRYAAISQPPLTTVAQPATDIGRQVALMLLAAIETSPSSEPRQVVVPHRLVLRRSVAAPSG